MDNPQSDLGQMVVLPLCDLEQVTAPSVPLICRVSLITSFSQDSEENLVGPLVGGVCIIPSVLSHRSKDLKWWTSITAQLQLSFIWQAKDSTSSRHEGGPTPK